MNTMWSASVVSDNRLNRSRVLHLFPHECERWLWMSSDPEHIWQTMRAPKRTMCVAYSPPYDDVTSSCLILFTDIIGFDWKDDRENMQLVGQFKYDNLRDVAITYMRMML